MKTKLKEHNVEAYENSMKLLHDGVRYIALERPMGTGKSYIASAIMENYDSVLYLAPNQYLINYFLNVVDESEQSHKVTTATYHSLIFPITDQIKKARNKFDLIIIDEYYHLGAKRWGEEVRKVISNNEYADVLGITATEVRFLDNMRNMTEEFGLTVASRLSIIDSMKRGITPTPKYIRGVTDITFLIDELLSKATKLDSDIKTIEELKKLRVDCINSGGVSEILRKYLPRDTKKLIVFSESVSKYSETERSIYSWLSSAGFNRIRFFRADSSNRKKAFDSIEDFSSSTVNDGEIYVIIAINMLNEGIHVEGATASIMLRSTSSKNIYLQQFGRITTSCSSKKPIIFDLVDNLNREDLWSYFGLKFDQERLDDQTVKKTCKEIPGLVIYDEVQHAKELFERFENILGDKNRFWSPSVSLDLLEKFHNTKNQNPSSVSTDQIEVKLNHACFYYMKNFTDPICKQIRNSWIHFSRYRKLTIDEVIEDLRNFQSNNDGKNPPSDHVISKNVIYLLKRHEEGNQSTYKKDLLRSIWKSGSPRVLSKTNDITKFIQEFKQKLDNYRKTYLKNPKIEDINNRECKYLLDLHRRLTNNKIKKLTKKEVKDLREYWNNEIPIILYRLDALEKSIDLKKLSWDKSLSTTIKGQIHRLRRQQHTDEVIRCLSKYTDIIDKISAILHKVAIQNLERRIIKYKNKEKFLKKEYSRLMVSILYFQKSKNNDEEDIKYLIKLHKLLLK